MKNRWIITLIGTTCILTSAGAVLGDEVVSEIVDESSNTPWHIIKIPSINKSVDLKNYFARAMNRATGILTKKVEQLDLAGVDRILGELGLPDLGALSSELIGIGRSELEGAIFAPSKIENNLNLGNYQIAVHGGLAKSLEIQAKIVEAELSKPGQAEKKAELEAIEAIVQNTIAKANRAGNSNISQEVMKAIAAQNADAAVLLQQIYQQNLTSITEQKLIRHGQLLETLDREIEKLKEIERENREFSTAAGAMFEFSATLMPKKDEKSESNNRVNSAEPNVIIFEPPN
ncbi:MAG: hypothetical protein QNJ38_18500 [Prochloraceae cyanobacterium]|nr:hypothetical protein [Prochloraceae cyanobacterium]